MGGGKPKTQTTKSTYEMSPEQRALIEPAVSVGQDYVKNPPKLPTGSQVAPFNPTQQFAQNSILGSILPQQQLIGQGGSTTNFLLKDVLNPSSNKALRGYMDAATRPITENLLEEVLPGIRSEAITAGQLGGSRQGIAEGLAARGASRAIGDTNARIASEAYGQGLDAQTKALGLLPQTLQTLLMPGQTAGAVGDARQQMEQRLLSEAAYKQMYAQMAPWLAAKDVAAVGAGLPGGTAVNTGPAGQTTSPMQGALGGAAMGAAIPGLGPLGAIGGGGLGLLMSLFQ